MKKLAVLVATVAMLSVSCVTAFAASSPEVKVESGSGSGSGNGSGSVGGYACPVLSTTSAKTGVTADPAIFAALGVVACGGIAVVAKKKMHA